jgi:rsbT co-antagonist protein RsbR
MPGILARLIEVRHSDADFRRRGRNVIIITLGVILMSLASLPLVLIQPDPGPQLVAPLAGSLVAAGLIALARAGRVSAASSGLVGLLLVGLTLTPLGSRQVGLVPVFMLIAVMIAGVIGRPGLVAITTAATVAGTTAIGVTLADEPQKLAGAGEVVAVSAILAVMAGLIGSLGARSTTRALDSAREAQARAELAASALDAANHDLERRVEERTAALQRALEETQRREEEQRRLLAQVETQRQTIRAMRVPVLPVSAGTLVMPLVGDLDSGRMRDLQDAALDAVERSGARRLLLDVTGVPLVDAEVARGLIGVVRSVRLLGAEAVLIGVAPEVAQTLVGLGLDLQGLHTERDLREALQAR